MKNTLNEALKALLEWGNDSPQMQGSMPPIQLDHVCMLAVAMRLEKRLIGIENAIKDLTFEIKNK